MSELRKNVRNKKSVFLWTKQCNQEFTDVKRALQSAPCRSFAMFTYDKEQAGPIIITADFSAKEMSAILSQVQNGKEQLIACAGRKCSPQ